jgi:tetratricopeptide (TPR) repeat protein/nucleotide-binding universal stress UspA family protein
MKTRIGLAALLVALSLDAASGWAQTPGKPPEQLGRVSFANSCAPAAQPAFERAVALLHSFWWREAESACRDVLARDPNCAIATWGIATTLIGNPFATGPSPAQAQQAVEALERGRAIVARSERERLFIEVVAQYYERFAERAHGARMKSLVDAFENLARRFREDDEAQIFSAIYLTATQSPTDKTFASTLRAASILEAQFKKHPDHPGVAHYLIHAYDYPPIAEKGLTAARRYAEIAPSAPHARHMPSHIFTRVGAWQEVVDSNVRSASVAKAEKAFDDQLHAMDYLVYGYLQLARDTDAQRVVQEAPGVRGTETGRVTPYALAAIPARYVLERGTWKEAAQLEPQATRFRFTAALTHFARAVGAARTGDAAAAERDVQELARIVDALRAAKDTYWATEVEVQRLGAAAWVAFAGGNRQAGLDLMRAAADLEDQSEKAAVSPGRLVPARELLGDMLLESGQPASALTEYERSQARDPNRFRGLYGAGEAAARSGNSGKARYYFARLVEMAGAGDPRPETEKARRYLAGH